MTSGTLRTTDPRGGPAQLRACFLAFEFPPYAAGGVYRPAKLAKYLPRSGVELDVVTARTEDYATWGSSKLDHTLGDDLPASVRIHRVPIRMPGWYRRWLENRLGHLALQWWHWADPLSDFWREPLFNCLDRLFAVRRPDVLLATAPPFGVAVLAREVAHRYRLPWVVDWRDPWTMWCTVPYPSYGHYRLVRHYEGACLQEANVSVCTSPVTRQDWLAEFPEADPDRLQTIYNGFDPEELSRVGAEPVPGGRARIVYVGTFYYDPRSRDAVMRPAWKRLPHRWLHYRKRREDWLYRSPYFFLRGLRRLADRHPRLSERLEVVFAGPVPDWLPRMLAETGTESLVMLRGVVPHRESLELQAGATALLLTSAKVLGGRDYSIAGKAFEYIGLRRPILAVVTEGAMRELIAQTGLAITADPDDADAVASAIEAITAVPHPIPVLTVPQEDFVRSLHRAQIAKQMAAQLRRATIEGYRG